MEDADTLTSKPAPFIIDGATSTSTAASRDSAPIVGIFTYGSLRVDSAEPTPYTQQFNKDCTHAPATLPDATLYLDASCGYAAVSLEGGKGVKGQLVTPPDLLRKVMEADAIEGVGKGLYERTVATVVLECGKQVRAHVYHRPALEPESCYRIDGGDWVTRDINRISTEVLVRQHCVERDVACRAIARARGDVRLACSFIKWGMV